MSGPPHVVVLGAGVVGCATAYYLSRRGVKVTVVEREAIGSCASGFALGLLSPLTGTGIPGPMAPFAEAAFKTHSELWPALQDETGMDLQVRLMPHLEVFIDGPDADEHRAEVEHWSGVSGFSTRWLSADEVRALEPRLAPDVHSGVLVENVVMLDSYRYTLALAQAAERHGAHMASGEVLGLVSEGRRVMGVRLRQGEIACDSVVLALGPWSGQASAWLGFDVPVKPLKGQIIYLEGGDPSFPYHMHGPCSVVQKADGMVWVGATEEPVGFDDKTTDEARDYLMHRALKMIPCLEQRKLLRQTACLRPVTPDSQPIVGEAPGWDGVFLATGTEKKGILISPAVGQAVADLIIDGETSLPIEPFAPERFAALAPGPAGEA